MLVFGFTSLNFHPGSIALLGLLALSPPERVAAQGPTEELHASDPSDKGPPPDDPNEPDVGKRPRFLWLMGRQKLRPFDNTIRALELLHKRYERSEDKPIPDDRKKKLLDVTGDLLLPAYMPRSPESVQWYAAWSSPLLYDAQGKFVERGPLGITSVLAEWSVDDYVIRAGGGIRIRLPKRPELRPIPKPPDFQGYTSDWTFISEDAVRDVLAEFFAVPFDEYNEFWVRGYIEHLAGVDVFVGTFGLRSRPDGYDPPPRRRSEPDPLAWGGKHRILITDSDPQYICVGFVFPK